METIQVASRETRTWRDITDTFLDKRAAEVEAKLFSSLKVPQALPHSLVVCCRGTCCWIERTRDPTTEFRDPRAESDFATREVHCAVVTAAVSLAPSAVVSRRAVLGAPPVVALVEAEREGRDKVSAFLRFAVPCAKSGFTGS